MKKIAIASGKGGTGKTFIATNLALTFQNLSKNICYLDCDVEEPNGHLFLKPVIDIRRDITLTSPSDFDPAKCTFCGLCSQHCQFNAIAVTNDQVFFFNELCHVCGACQFICPNDAIIEKLKVIGEYREGRSGNIKVKYSLLKTGEGGRTTRLITDLKQHCETGINLIDAPPGTACPAIESVKDTDLTILVTDPTPFGIHDLQLSVDTCRQIGIEPLILINRAEGEMSKLKLYCQNENLTIIGEIPDNLFVAEIYSRGDLVINHLPEYEILFKKLAAQIMLLLKSPPKPHVISKNPDRKIPKIPLETPDSSAKLIGKHPGKELVVISGKGGTGKTSITAALANLEKNLILSDCDVDAADLHLITKPELIKKGRFSGGLEATIHTEQCTECGKCFEYCKFQAILPPTSTTNSGYIIDPTACEGCGICQLVCNHQAISLSPAVNGEWFVSNTRFGPMTHARLGPAEENSGRLVTLVREKAAEISNNSPYLKTILADGAPGTGCPVIASLTGTNYALVVTEATVSGVHDLKRVLDLTRHFRIKSGIIINKFDLNRDQTQKIRDISKTSGIKILGEIPYDKSFTKSQMEGKTIFEFTDNQTTKIIRNIWLALTKELNG